MKNIRYGDIKYKIALLEVYDIELKLLVGLEQTSRLDLNLR